MRKWLQSDFGRFIDSLGDEDLAIATFAEIRQTWEIRGFGSLPQQKNLLGEFRTALKAKLEGDALALALRIATFTPEEWDEANAPTRKMARRRNENQLELPVATVNTLMVRATQLLLSDDWTDIATGLLALTGRRPAEVLKTAEFTLCTPYSVRFTGAVKRSDDIEYEIPTLCSADYVINALNKLRSLLDTTDLDISDLNNSQYTVALADRVREQFGDILSGNQKRLSSDDLRPIYTRIAIYYYCPPRCCEDEFAAHVLGHFDSDTSRPMRERRLISDNRPYKDYRPIDHGKRGTRLSWQGVAVLRDFQPESEVQTMTKPAPDPRPEKKRNTTPFPIWYEDKNRWVGLLDAIAPEQSVRKEDRSRHLLNWIEAKLQEPTPEPDNSLTDVIREQARAIALLSARTDSPDLRQRIAVLEDENQSLREKLDQIHQVFNPVGQQGNGKPDGKPEMSSPSPSRVSTRDRDGGLDPDVVRVVNAIMDYNDCQADHDSKWAISFPVMKHLGKANQKKIAAVFDAMRSEIDAHHQKHGLGPRHNRKHQGQAINDFIKLQPTANGPRLSDDLAPEADDTPSR